MNKFNFNELEPKKKFFTKLKEKFKKKPLKTLAVLFFELAYMTCLFTGIIFLCHKLYELCV